jgi:hypothetical protein
MDPLQSFSLDFIGWFYTVACAIAIAIGGAIFAFLYVNGQIATRYKDYSILNDVMLLVIWVIGLIGALGVLDRSQWGQFLLQLFCWMLIALVSTSGATRLYTLKKLHKTLTRRDWLHSLIGVVLVVLPIVVFCLGTIMSLRTDEARTAFGLR